MGVRFPTRVRTTQVPYDRPIPRFQSCPKNTMGNFPRGFLCELLVVELKNSLGLGSNPLRCTVPRNSKTVFSLVSSYLHLVKQSPPVHQTIFGKLVSSRMIQSPLYSAPILNLAKTSDCNTQTNGKESRTLLDLRWAWMQHW